MDIMQDDIKVPRSHWNQLTSEDKEAFRQLHVHFIAQQKEHIKERKNNSFFNDIVCLMKYIEYTPVRRDDRAICVGLSFSGPFCCVNTQQLKIILGRCKSSINNSFQQIGYDAVKNKSKSREAVLALIPSLFTEQNTLRKWTVRCVSENAQCCFCSVYRSSQLPFIADDDLYDDKRSVHRSQAMYTSHETTMFSSPISISSNVSNPLQISPPQPSQLPIQQIALSEPTQQPHLTVLPPMNFMQVPPKPSQHHKNSNFDNSYNHNNNNNNNSNNNNNNNTENNNINNDLNNNLNNGINRNVNNNVNNNKTNMLNNRNGRKMPMFDLSFFSDDEMTIPEITPSFSMDYLADVDFGNDDDSTVCELRDSLFANPTAASNAMPRSQSAFLSFGDFC